MTSVFALALLLQVGATAPSRTAAPVLEFPTPGLDDSAAYAGYRTRLLRDARGNAVQVYLNQREGRVVHLWADAANQSVAFSARRPDGEPAALRWQGSAAVSEPRRGVRAVEYTLIADGPLELGLFVLGSMRWERDFQYARGHLGRFDQPSYRPDELVELIEGLAGLEAAERGRHLALLHAGSVVELEARLQPSIWLQRNGNGWTMRAEQPSLDGRRRLALQLGGNGEATVVELTGATLRLRPVGGAPVAVRVRVETDAPTLTPLAREEIFNREFLRFYEQMRRAQGAASPAVRRVERQLRGAELLSYREKLMAGLPNFATYFGRDMLMTALMMEPVWTAAMTEHVIASVLRKLSPQGEVSHEEALAGQAVREHAARYSALLAEQRERRARGEHARADSLLARARDVLADLQAVREDYRMLDDDFQLPVLVARYLGRADLSAERQRSFLLAAAQEDGGPTRLRALLRNLAYVARTAEPYARDPRPARLVAFAPLDQGRWFPGSWRDSGAGYADGRYAMDINVIWVPAALRSLERILTELRRLGWDAVELEALAPEIRGTALARLARSPAALRQVLEAWERSERHFRVELEPEEVHAAVRARLSRLADDERRYWTRVLGAHPPAPLHFLALSLDAGGRPLRVVNTDPATRLFLEDLTGEVLAGRSSPEAVLRDVAPMLAAYPVGLLVEGLGPLVANDAYAGPAVWERFWEDTYHSPLVVWGREVNLLLLGLVAQIQRAFDGEGRLREPRLEPYVRQLCTALRRAHAAVEASGLKHAELWSYRIDAGRLQPVRYGTGSDVQLWNLTDLAVQFQLSRLPRAGCPVGVVSP